MAESCPIHLRTFALFNTPPNGYYSRASPFHTKAIEEQILQYISSEQHHPHRTLQCISSSPISHPIHGLSSLICLSFFSLHPSHDNPSDEEDLKRRSTSSTMNSGDDTAKLRPPHHFIRGLSTHSKVDPPLSLPFLKHEFPLDLWNCASDFLENFLGIFHLSLLSALSMVFV